MVDISIIIPGIRPDRWSSIYNSIQKSTRRSFELIMCGPYLPPPELNNKKNFKFIKDWGSPVRASCLAAEIAEGDMITWSADDALFIENSLDLLANECDKDGHIISCKYIEGKNGSPKPIQPNEYFTLNGSTWTSSPRFQNDWYLLNTGIMPMKTFKDLGGWDCRYDVAFYSYADMAATSYLQGVKSKFAEDIILLDCDHFAGSTGDHGPIENAQTHHDLPAFKMRFCSNDLNLSDRVHWTDSPKVWRTRFND